MAEVLREVFAAPAIPYSVLGHPYPAEHVARTGPDLADNLVRFSETNEWLRSKLEAIASGDSAAGVLMATAMLTMSAVTYIVPQLAYFGILKPELAVRVGAPPIPGRDTAPAPPPPAEPVPFDPRAAADAADAAQAVANGGVPPGLFTPTVVPSSDIAPEPDPEPTPVTKPRRRPAARGRANGSTDAADTAPPAA